MSHHGTVWSLTILSAKPGVSGGASLFNISCLKDPTGWMLPMGYGKSGSPK
jgi:hypothetical protein